MASLRKFNISKSQSQEDRGRPEERNRAPTDNDYVLQRDYAATTRLNCQFLLWKMELGWNIHPRIPEPPPSAYIADVATGSGIWMLDVSRTLPGRQFYGFDISLQQCPPAEWLPPSIHLQQWDIFSPLPVEFTEMFDIVHIRLLALVIKDNDPTSVIKNVKQMLKPGGYLQWDELDVASLYVASTDPSVDLQSYQLSPELSDTSRFQWMKNLKQTIADHGFVTTEENNYECDLALAKFFQDANIMVIEEVAASQKDEAEKQKYVNAIRDVQQETAKGVTRCAPKKVFVAQKPHD